MLLCAALGTASVRAQLPCDPPVPVVILAQDLGGNTFEFTLQTPGGNYTVQSYTWSFGDGSVALNSTSPMMHTFQNTGNYLVCCAVDLLINGIPCTTAGCVVQAVQAAPCPGVVPEFTATFNNDSLQLIDLTYATDSVIGYFWDLGDGSSSFENSPIHQFAGAGPYLICLSVTVLDSTNQTCTSTVCHWFYTGPIDPPCAQILTPYFTWQEQNGFVAFQDSSQTTGLQAQYVWDFGDGTFGVDQNELHYYPYPGTFTVCQTVTLTGPLLTDSCVATYCTDVYVGWTIAGIEEPGVPVTLHPWPNPASGSIRVELPAAALPGVLTVHDISGRTVRSVRVTGSTELVIDLDGFSAGHYTLRSTSAAGQWSGRFILSTAP